jgi:hypothetical protein
MAGISKKRKKNLYCNRVNRLPQPTARAKTSPVAIEVSPSWNTKFRQIEAL